MAKRAERFVSLSMSFNSSIRSKETAINFFNLFKRDFPRLEFKVMGQWEPLRNRFNLSDAMEEWQQNRGTPSKSEFGDSIFQGTKPALFYAFVRWHGSGSSKRWADSVSVMFDERFWTQKLVDDMSSRAVNLLKAFSTLAIPLYGRGYHSSEFEAKDFRERVLKDGRVSRESIVLTPREGIVDLFWLNYFGRAYVDIFGEHSLDEISCLQKEKTGEGFLLRFAKDPFDWDDPEVLSLEKKAKEELNHDAFFVPSKNIQPSLNI